MPKVQASANRLISLFDEARKGESEAHVDVLRRLYVLTERRTRSGDLEESKYYEGWDAILNYLRAQTNMDITIAPQRRFTRNFYEEKEPGQLTAENLSTEANVSGADLSILSADVSTDTNQSELANSNTSAESARSMRDPVFRVDTQSRIPDFALFHTHAVSDHIVKDLFLLVEIKPYKSKDPNDVRIQGQFESASLQVVIQALFALDDESSDITEIKVLCVIGWHWHLLAFRTGQTLHDVPEGDYQQPENDGFIMLPRMPQGKFHDEVWNVQEDVQRGYTNHYIRALDDAWSDAFDQMTNGHQSVFIFEDGHIVGYEPAFLSAWSAVVENAKIPRKWS